MELNCSGVAVEARKSLIAQLPWQPKFAFRVADVQISFGLDMHDVIWWGGEATHTFE